ncbi:hypothetical protein [Nannocystis pusilla]|uniref:hypothetical protein n=1 Tax=Nannocystis pusilla TaxID=889268 RepID=UPI003B7CCA6C
MRCQNVPKQPSADPPRLAKRSAAATTATLPSETPKPDVTATSNAGETPAPTTTTTIQPHAHESDPLLPVTGRSPVARETPRDPDGGRSSPVPRDAGRDADRPAGETPWRSPVPLATPPRPGRELLIAGGVTLSVGVGLTAAAGVMGGRMLDIWRDANALCEENGPVGPGAVADQSDALARDYRRLQAPMIAVAVIGGSALVVGAVLTGIGAKRLSRATSRAALLPAPGGLVLHARF